MFPGLIETLFINFHGTNKLPIKNPQFFMGYSLQPKHLSGKRTHLFPEAVTTSTSSRDPISASRNRYWNVRQSVGKAAKNNGDRSCVDDIRRKSWVCRKLLSKDTNASSAEERAKANQIKYIRLLLSSM